MIKATNYPFIVIEGNIGAGKTTLARNLAEKYNGKLLLEKFENNPFLQDFYCEPNKYAFQVEINFLIDRYQQLFDFQQMTLFNEFSISDFYFNKSLIFSTKTLNEHEYRLYEKIYNIINTKLPLPNLYVYLKQPFENLLQNIKKRGRQYEQQISKEYLEKIDEAYYNYFKTVKDFPILIIDLTKVNIFNEKDVMLLEEPIFKQKYKDGINYL